jgi:hypothetical protein
MRWAAGILVPLLFGCNVPPEVRAQESSNTTLTGSLRLLYFSSSRDLNDVADVLGTSAEFELQHTDGDNQWFELEGRLLSEDLIRRSSHEVRLRNAYWRIRWDRIDLRVGQQQIRWGKADGINPTDFFTPIDFAVLLPLEDDQYRSVPAVRNDVYLNDTDSLSLVVEPDFTRSRLPEPKPAPVSIMDDEPSGWSTPQVGLRWSHTGENLDWSLSAFHGFSTLPLLDYAGAAAEGTPQYSRYYAAADGFGLDVARNFGKLGFRAELAYTSLDTEGRQGASSNYFLVSGIDRSFGSDANINLQALVRYAPDFRSAFAFSNPQQQLAAVQNAIVYNQQDQFTYGMTARVVIDWLHRTLQTELLAVTSFDPTNAIVKPLVTYAVSDQRKIRFGAEYYSGPDLSWFGSLKANRTIFVELQQFF